MLTTPTLSLERWEIALQRLDEHVHTQRNELAKLQTPIEFDLDSQAFKLARAAEIKECILDLTFDLDRAIVLQMDIERHCYQAEHALDLPDIQKQLQTLRQLISLLEGVLDAPSRKVVMDELGYAQRRLEELRLAGEGDSIRAERQRLKALKFKLPAVGAEDLTSLKEYLHILNVEHDNLTAQRAEIRARSGFHMQVSESRKALLDLLGIATEEVQVEKASLEPEFPQVAEEPKATEQSKQPTALNENATPTASQNTAPEKTPEKAESTVSLNKVEKVDKEKSESAEVKDIA